MTRRARSRLLAAGGLFLLGLGGVGLVVPLLPTTPFVLAAAACFSRSSPRLDHWLTSHPRLGPPIRAWRASRAIPPYAKTLAVLAMAASYAVVLATTAVPPLAQIAVAVTLLAAAGYVLTRPSR